MEGSITSWTIFLVVVTALIVGIYYIFKNSAIGQLFGDIFGFLASAAAAMDDKLKECEDAGFFSIKCGVGIWAIVAGIGAVLFGIGKWLLGPAGDTKAGELWRSVKGTGVTTNDLVEIKANVDTLAEEWKADPKNSQKVKLIDDYPGGEELFRRSIAINEIHREITKNLNANDPTDAKLIELANAARDNDLNKAKATFRSSQTDDNDPPEQDTDDIADYGGEVIGE